MIFLASRSLPYPSSSSRHAAGAWVASAMLLFVLCLSLFAAPAHAEDNFLPPEQAFKFSAQMADAQTLEVSYDIADGYYMYRERFHFKADNGATLGQPIFPAGTIKFDQTFQKNVETYRHKVSIRIPLSGDVPFRLTSTAQGCTDQGLCYSPMDSFARLMPISTADGNTMSATVEALTATGGTTSSASGNDNNGSDVGRIQASLQSGKLLAILPLFFLLGLGLSLTPCVLPMVPILSSIVVGEGARSSRGRGLLLSVVYALGMALVYTALGVAAGLVGEGLAAALQNPWVLTLFALLLIALSLSMFGFYELQVPASWQTRLTQISGSQGGGKLIGVFVMGAISALIVGPCVAAPLAGALLYISQTRDVFIGGSALFAMAVGMSVPLLLVGMSAGALLPRAGGWMEGVKRFFGVLMLATALWMAMPVLPAVVGVAGWALLGLGYGAYLLWGQPGGWAAKGLGVAVLILGGLQLVSVATGGRDALAPLAQLGGAQQSKIEFRRVKSEAELDAVLAQTGGKPVMLDFYADWCTSCIEMERNTYTDPRVRAALANFILLKADVTANNADDKALLKRFSLFGPPGIIFYDAAGRKQDRKTLIGYENAEQFVRRLGPAV